MKRFGITTLVAVALSSLAASAALAAPCANSVAKASSGELWRGDICDANPSGSRLHALCGRTLLTWPPFRPWTGKDAAFTWVVPESGRWNVQGSGSGLNALQIGFDASKSCGELEVGLSSVNGDSICENGTNPGLMNLYLEKGQKLVVIADSKAGICGEAVVEALLAQSCSASAADLGSELGKVVSQHTTSGTEATNAVRTTCGGNSLPLFSDRSRTERLGERLYRWKAPADGTYNFLAESTGHGVTLAVLNDGLCPEIGDTHHAACQTIHDGAAARSRNVTMNDMVKDQEVILVVKQRDLDRPITFDLSISEDICTTTETTSALTLTGTLRPGSVFQGPGCVASKNEETKHIRWVAPHTGEFTFTDKHSGLEADVGFVIRAGSCNGEELACAATEAGPILLEKGEEVVLSINRTSVMGWNYRIVVANLGCGDGVKQPSEECDYEANSNDWACPAGYTLGAAECTEICELDTRECLGNCPTEDTCDARAGADTFCNPDDDCVYSCKVGFADCDGDLNVAQGEPSNGCEVDLSEPATCGSCGVLCGNTQTCDVDPLLGFSCSGAVDCFVDADGDQYGTGTPTAENGNCPAGTTPRGDDCDDTNPNVHPGMAEVCNGVDDNCDGKVDEVNDALCPDVEGAVGSCEAASGSGNASCSFTCEDGLKPVGGNAQNGCTKDGKPDPETPGPGDGNEDPNADISLGGGRFFEVCSAGSLGGLSPLLLALFGVALASRRRRRAA